MNQGVCLFVEKEKFRDQKQDQFYNTPFGGYGPNLFGEPAPVARAKGGKIESDTDKLMRLIGE